MTRPPEPDASPHTFGAPTAREDDPLLAKLAGVARDRAREERERLDGRWDRLAAGKLPAEEEAALRAEDSFPEAFAAFEPLGAAAVARIVEKIRAQRAAEALVPRAPVPEASGVATTAPTASIASAAPPSVGKVLPFRRRVALWSGALGLAAAAALVAVLVVPGRSAPLPGYKAEIGGGERTARGNSGTEVPGLPTFSPGARFDLILRPARPVEGKVAVRCLLVAAGGGPPRPFPACDDAQLSADGSLRIAGTIEIVGGTAGGIELEPGDWTLWALLARPGELPDAPPVSGRAEPIAGKRWLGIPVAVRFAAAV